MRGRAAGAAALALATVLALPSGAAPRGTPRPDPLRPLQWGLDQIGIPAAWHTSRGRGVVVAVVDSGVDPGQPDLRGALVPGHDFTGGTSTADDCGHGTEVAGVIAARADNGIGIAGAAPLASVMPLRDGVGCTVNLTATLAAIRYAVAHHARVINISQATQPVVGDAGFAVLDAADFQAAVDDAWAHGTLVVAGAGNSSLPTCAYPAALHHVLCVGAVDRDRLREYYSQGDATGTVDFLVAPGGGPAPEEPTADGGIWTTDWVPGAGTTVGSAPSHPGYADVSGTSFAAPFVSAVAALLFSTGLNVAQVHDRLLATAHHLGVAGRDPLYGAGEVDAAAALRGTP